MNERTEVGLQTALIVGAAEAVAVLMILAMIAVWAAIGSGA
jgi:hypothetical protein